MASTGRASLVRSVGSLVVRTFVLYPYPKVGRGVCGTSVQTITLTIAIIMPNKNCAKENSSNDHATDIGDQARTLPGVDSEK